MKDKTSLILAADQDQEREFTLSLRGPPWAPLNPQLAPLWVCQCVKGKPHNLYQDRGEDEEVSSSREVKEAQHASSPRPGGLTRPSLPCVNQLCSPVNVCPRDKRPGRKPWLGLGLTSRLTLGETGSLPSLGLFPLNHQDYKFIATPGFGLQIIIVGHCLFFFNLIPASLDILLGRAFRRVC